MTTAPTFSTAGFRSKASAVPSSSSVFLPKEHGSWSLALESIALGLLVAPSSAGGALAVATLAGFFMRRPLRNARAPRADRPWSGAEKTLLLFGLIALGGVAECVVLGGFRALWPLLPAAPLAGLFLYFDRRNEARALPAELAGTAAFALVPAAIATTGGWPAPFALGLSALMLARTLPTILTVRGYLRQAKRPPGDSTNRLAALLPVLAATGAVLALAGLTVAGLVPRVAVLLALLLLARSILYAMPGRPVWSAQRLGMLEAGLGIIYVATLAYARSKT